MLGKLGKKHGHSETSWCSSDRRQYSSLIRRLNSHRRHWLFAIGEIYPDVTKLLKCTVEEVKFRLDVIELFVDLLYILVSELSIRRIPQPVPETFLVNLELDFQLEVCESDETIDRSFIPVGHTICIYKDIENLVGKFCFPRVIQIDVCF